MVLASVAPVLGAQQASTEAVPPPTGLPSAPQPQSLAGTLVAPVSVALLPTIPTPQSSPATSAKSSAHVSGTITDAQGALVAGARIQISSPRSPTQSLTSGNDGRFSFTGVLPGGFTMTVNAPGFTAASVNGTVLPEERLEMPPFVLQPAMVNITVDAVETTDELALEQLHAEEHQRLVGVFPNFFVSYNWHAPALSPRQKFSLSWRNATDPGNLFLVGTTAGIQQADNAFPGYHQGAAGYGKRYGADLGNLVSGTFLGGAILPVLFHQDPRYFFKGTGTTRSRVLYALSTAVICRGDNGHRQPAFASVLGDLSAGAISNLYYAPTDRQGATLTLENGLLGIAGDAMNNIFQEFVLPHFTSKAGGKSQKP